MVDDINMSQPYMLLLFFNKYGIGGANSSKMCAWCLCLYVLL